ncbi:MAG: hypothetical protein WD063_06095, partial [Pirellulales bacterium]
PSIRSRTLLDFRITQHLYPALAEKERRLISERTKAANARRVRTAQGGRSHVSNVRTLLRRAAAL